MKGFEIFRHFCFNFKASLHSALRRNGHFAKVEQKGAKLVYDICNHIGQDIIFAGPNILNLEDTKHCKFIGFVDPVQRMHLLSDAKFLFAPSFFNEKLSQKL